MTEVIIRSGTDGPDWAVCPACSELIYLRRLARAQQVCPECGNHHRLSAAERIDQLLDDGYVPLDHDVRTSDVLGFSDTRPYPVRLDAARSQTGLSEGALVVEGQIDGHPLVAAVMDFAFLGGSLGAAVGELVTLAAERALETSTPLLIVSASGGARMQEGAVSLMQMAKTAQALGRLDEAGVLTVSLVTDPTYGGVAASFATLCDVLIAEPGARLGFAGPRVIRQTIRESLPEGFQTAEFLLAHGLIDMITPRGELRGTVARLLAAGGVRKPGRPRAVRDRSFPVALRDPGQVPRLDAWDTVQRARDLARPTLTDYLAHVFEDFQELHGDRLGDDCPAMVGGLARLDGIPVVVLGQHKGHDLAELTERNFGMARPSGYRKAARLMRLAAKLGLPVITLVDTPGAYPGIAAEEQGQAVAIAESIRLMSQLPVPIVAIVVGEGGSGGALGLAVADEVLIVQHGVYSVISPEGCASILWKDPQMAPDAARALRLDARELLELGIVDAVVPEPRGGSGTDHAAAADLVRQALSHSLGRLRGRDARWLVDRRRSRFRAFGTPGAGARDDVRLRDGAGADPELERGEATA